MLWVKRGAIGLTFLAEPRTANSEAGKIIVNVVGGLKPPRIETKKERDREIDRSEEIEGTSTPTHIETTAANAERIKGTISDTVW
jgi:hypothetical protein